MENLSKAEYSTNSVTKVTYSVTAKNAKFSDSDAITLERTICSDEVIVEQPLQVTLSWFENGLAKTKIFSITMRTPGQDQLLILGLLHSEGIFNQLSDIESIEVEQNSSEENYWQNEWLVQFVDGFIPNLASLERFQVTYSSCGLCGATSLKALQLKTQINLTCEQHNKAVSVKTLLSIAKKMRSQQGMFTVTGGVHGAALFDQQVNLLHIHEDIGRHNAVDKVIGAVISERGANELMLDNAIPLHMLLVSGRISFEIVQKSIMAGFSILIGVGAPSALAIQAAKRFDLTLIGFINDNGFNVYHGDWRLSNLS